MPDDNTSDVVSNSDSPENSEINSQSSGSSSNKSENNSKVSAQLTNFGLNLLTSTKQIKELKTDVKQLSSAVESLTTSVDSVKTAIKPIQEQVEKNRKLNEIQRSQISNINEAIRRLRKNASSQKENTKNKSEKDVEKSSKPSSKEQEELAEKIKNVLMAVLPKMLKNNKDNGYKTNSKINETVQPVTVKSFSVMANQQLVNNIKQALQIKKQQDSFVSKSNLIKLAILAFIGIVIYLLMQLKEVRESIAKQIQEIKDGFNSIVDTIKQWFIDLKNDFLDMIYTPLVDSLNNFSTSISNTFESWKKHLADMMPTSLSEFIDSVKTAFIDVKNFFTNDFIQMIMRIVPAFKEFINKVIGFDIFTIEKEELVEPEPEDSTKDVENQNTDNSGTLGNLSNQISSNKNTPGSTPPPPEATQGGNVNNSTKVENTDIVKIAGNQLAQKLINTIILQNGKMVKLNKSDDIYIANKPDGVIANIFKEINANYTKVYDKLTSQFGNITDNIQEQDRQLVKLCDNLGNININTQSDQSKQAIAYLQQQILSLQSASTQDTIYDGIDNVRKQIRFCLDV